MFTKKIINKIINIKMFPFILVFFSLLFLFFFLKIKFELKEISAKTFLKMKNWTQSLKMLNCEENCSVFKEARVVKWNKGRQISL